MQDLVGVCEATTAASSRCWRSAEVAASSGMSCTACLNHFIPGSCVACSASSPREEIAKHCAMPAHDWMHEDGLCAQKCSRRPDLGPEPHLQEGDYDIRYISDSCGRQPAKSSCQQTAHHLWCPWRCCPGDLQEAAVCEVVFGA